MKKTTLNAIAIGTAALPLAFLSIIYNRLPQTVPLHFGLDMHPDRWGDKSELWFSAVLLALVSVGVYFLMKNLHRIDPKRYGANPSAVFQKLGWGLLVFMALLNFFIIELTKGNTSLTWLLFPLLGLLFAFTGNYLHNIKPNYFAGFRLPWTLNDEDNWRKTHRLGGRLWFGGGLLIAAVCPFLSITVAFIFFIAVMSVMVCIPLIYSYRLFKNSHKAL